MDNDVSCKYSISFKKKTAILSQVSVDAIFKGNRWTKTVSSVYGFLYLCAIYMISIWAKSWNKGFVHPHHTAVVFGVIFPTVWTTAEEQAPVTLSEGVFLTVKSPACYVCSLPLTCVIQYSHEIMLWKIIYLRDWVKFLLLIISQSLSNFWACYILNSCGVNESCAIWYLMPHQCIL